MVMASEVWLSSFSLPPRLLHSSSPRLAKLSPSFSSSLRCSLLRSRGQVVRLHVHRLRATSEQQGQVQEEDEVEDSKILPYCSIDKKRKKSLGEMEQEFLQALQVTKQFYFIIFTFGFYLL